MPKKPPTPGHQSVTVLTPDDLAPILEKLEEHAALLGDHEERITMLESGTEGPGPPSDPSEIEAAVWRWDGRNGPVLVSSGVPLQPGQVTADTLSHVRVFVEAVEQPVALQPLRGTWPDGSYRSLGVQFIYDLTHDVPVEALIVLDPVGREPPDLAWVEPTKATVDMRAVIAPTDPVHLCGTLVTCQPLAPGATDTDVGADWNAALEYHWLDAMGGQICTGQQGGGAIYEHQNGLWAHYCRTGDRVFYQWAWEWCIGLDGETSMLYDVPGGSPHKLLPYNLPPTSAHATCPDNSVYNPELLNGMNSSCGNTAEWFSLRMLSLVSAYWMTAWRQPMRCLALRANYALTYASRLGYATGRDHWLKRGELHRFNFGFMGDGGVFAVLTGYLTECTTRFTGGLAGGYPPPDDFDYATYLPWTIDALEEYALHLGEGDYRNGLVGKQPGSSGLGPPATEVPADDEDFVTYMLSIPATYLMVYYDMVAPDPRIPGMLQTIGDYLIGQLGQAVETWSGLTLWAHHYISKAPPVTVNSSAEFHTPTLFAGLFAWLHAYTGDATYATWRDRLLNPDQLNSVTNNYFVKYWGDTFGMTCQSALYYRQGGTVRGMVGAHPTAIVNPPLHATLG